MQRYKYEFVRIEYKSTARDKFGGYREEIENRAAAGWRFVSTVLQPDFLTGGHFELVFEKPLEED